MVLDKPPYAPLFLFNLAVNDLAVSQALHQQNGTLVCLTFSRPRLALEFVLLILHKQ
jgi:hypothetical protein